MFTSRFAPSRADEIEIERVCTQSDLMGIAAQCDLLVDSLTNLEQIVTTQGLGSIDQPGKHIQSLTDVALWCNKLAGGILRQLEQHNNN